MPLRDLTRQGAYANPIAAVGGAAAAPASSAGTQFLAKRPSTLASAVNTGWGATKTPSSSATRAAIDNFGDQFVTPPTLPQPAQQISTPLSDIIRQNPTGYANPTAIMDPFRPTSSPMPTNYPDVFAGNSGRLPQPQEPAQGTHTQLTVPGGRPRVTITSSPPQQIAGTGWQDTIRNPGTVPGVNDPHWVDVFTPDQAIAGTGWQDTIRNPGTVPGVNDPHWVDVFTPPQQITTPLSDIIRQNPGPVPGVNDPHWGDVFGTTPTAAPTPFSMAPNPRASRNNSNPTYSTGGTG